MPKFVDLTGKQFGRLTVLGLDGKSPSGKHMYRCRCDCGNETTVINASLTGGKTTSCFQHSKAGIPNPKNATHNRSMNDITYTTWRSMRARCLTLTHHNYHNYGGRGISIDTSWLEFEGFLKDMGDRPENHSLDRIDVNGNYCKENCRWATQSTQAFNTRKSLKNKSGRTGVIFLKRGGKWRAAIQINLKYRSLGSFNTYEEACKAREAAELKYYNQIKE